MAKAILLLLLLVALPVPGLAFVRQADDSTSHSTDTIVVQATRDARTASTTPAAVSILEAGDIRRNEAAISIEESLREVPGLFINNRYNFSQGERISIRGLGSRAQFGVRNVRLVLDGIPLTFADGQAQLNTVDMSSIDRIEILRGPSAALYGNAAGGVIVMHSALSTPSDLRVAPALTIGGNDLRKIHLGVQGAAGDLRYLVSGSEISYGGFRDFSSAHLYNLTSLLRYNAGDSSTLQLSVHLHSTPYAFNPGGMSRSEAEADRTAVRPIVKTSGAGKRVQQGQVGLNFSGPLGNGDYLDASVYGIARTLYNPIVGSVIDLDRSAGGLRSVYRRDIRMETSLLRAAIGIDLDMQSDRREEYENRGIPADRLPSLSGGDILDAVQRGDIATDHTERIRTLGAFSHLSFMTEHWLFAIGGRYDSYTFDVEDHRNSAVSGRLSFGQFSPSIGVIHYLTSTVHLYGNIGTAFQTPTANELGNTPSGEGFNSAIRPETVYSAELGTRISFPLGSAEIAVFGFLANNQILPYQTEANSDITFYRNAGRTRNTGAEAAFVLDPFAGLRIRTHYTFMHYVFTDYLVHSGTQQVRLDGNSVPGVPKHHVFAGATYTHGSISGEINVQWISSYAANDFNGAPPGSTLPRENFHNDAYTVVDIRLGYRTSFGSLGLNIFGGINNVFNTRYNASVIPNAAGNRFFEPAPGRMLYAGVELPLALVGTL